MVTNSTQLIALIILVLIGAFIAIKPQFISDKLKNFYLNYPLIRYAGRKQLTSKPVYIVAFGTVIILIGAFGIYHHF